MPDQPPIPEIIVTEQRRGTPTIIPGTNIPAGPGGYRFSGLSGASVRNWWEFLSTAFVAPAVPTVVEEIVVTAPRPGAASAVSGAAEGVARWSLPLAIAGVVGLTAREILDDLGEQLLEREWREFQAIQPPTRRDSPLYTTQPEVIPEVRITQKRPFPQYAPAPIFFPDRYADPDPWIMQPIFPRAVPVAPQPVVVPDIATPAPPEIVPALPTITPAPYPLSVPTRQPIRLPRTRFRTDALPQTQTWIQTSPQLSPQTQLLTGAQASVSPLASTRTRTGTRAEVSPVTQTAAAANFGNASCVCPPCRKDEEQEEMRTACYKKLVKEGLFPSQDESYEWTEIDCLTGREL